jgi:hypothetical protein
MIEPVHISYRIDAEPPAMSESLLFSTASFEAIYGWLEAHEDAQVEVWGLEDDRRAALLAYRNAPPDSFGWSDWARRAYDDPSELSGVFETLELVTSAEVAAGLKAAFAGVFSPAASG